MPPGSRWPLQALVDLSLDRHHQTWHLRLRTNRNAVNCHPPRVFWVAGFKAPLIGKRRAPHYPRLRTGQRSRRSLLNRQTCRTKTEWRSPLNARRRRKMQSHRSTLPRAAQRNNPQNFDLPAELRRLCLIGRELSRHPDGRSMIDQRPMYEPDTMLGSLDFHGTDPARSCRAIPSR